MPPAFRCVGTWHRCTTAPGSRPRRRVWATFAAVASANTNATGACPPGRPAGSTGATAAVRGRWRRWRRRVCASAPAVASPRGVLDAGLFFLAGELLREHNPVDDGEDQALGFGRLRGFDLPLHRMCGTETVAVGEAGPAGVTAPALDSGRPVGAHLIQVSSIRVTWFQHVVRSTRSRSMPCRGSRNPRRTAGGRAQVVGGRSRTASTQDWAPKPRTTRTGMPYSAGQPVSSWCRLPSLPRRPPRAAGRGCGPG